MLLIFSTLFNIKQTIGNFLQDLKQIWNENSNRIPTVINISARLEQFYGAFEYLVTTYCISKSLYNQFWRLW